MWQFVSQLIASLAQWRHPEFCFCNILPVLDKAQSATHGKHKPSERCHNQECIKLKRKDFMSYSLNVSVNKRSGQPCT